MTTPTPGDGHRRIFADDELDRRFDRDGYVVHGNLDDAALDGFRRRFDEIGRPWTDGAMYSNVHELDPALNADIGRQINASLTPIVLEVCIDYLTIGGTLLVKGLGDASVCTIHQDWNSVDEVGATALVIWISMVDVTPENGCLVVAPGSHRRDLFPTIRSANHDNAHLPFGADLEPFLVDLPLRAGEICYFAQSLFHGSRPNLTEVPRPAVYAGARPVETPMVHYEWLDDDRYAVLPIDEHFYYSGDAGRLAQGISPPHDDRSTIVTDHRGEVSRSEFIDVMTELMGPPAAAPATATGGPAARARRWPFRSRSR